MTTGWRWLLWWTMVGLWALALLTPQPVDASKALLPEGAGYSAAKALHIGAYAFLTGAAAWLPPWRGWRWLPIAVLSLHGCGTEFFQQWVPQRHGCIADVGIDHLGIVLGLLFSWARWRRPI